MPYSGIDLIGGKKIDGYNTLFSGSGDMNCGHGIDIDREEWEQGYGLFAWTQHQQEVCTTCHRALKEKTMHTTFALWQAALQDPILAPVMQGGYR